MESIVNTNISSNVPEKKKRGRKKQNVVVPVENIQLATVEKPLPKNHCSSAIL